jgi:hypothetical protein
MATPVGKRGCRSLRAMLVELEEDAHGSLERAAERDQPTCLREINLGVVRHQRGACRVEAQTRELIEPPDARAKLLGLAWLDLGLDLLGLFHDPLRIDPQARPVMSHPAHRHVVAGTTRRDAARRRPHSEAQRAARARTHRPLTPARSALGNLQLAPDVEAGAFLHHERRHRMAPFRLRL